MVSLLKVKVMLAQSLSGWQRALTGGRWADQHSPWDEQGFTKHCSSRTGTHSWPRGQSPRPEPSIRQGLGPHHSCQREEASQFRNSYASLLTSVHDLTTSTTHRPTLTYLCTADNPPVTVTGVTVFSPLCSVYSDPTPDHTRTSGDWEKNKLF